MNRHRETGLSLREVDEEAYRVTGLSMFEVQQGKRQRLQEESLLGVRVCPLPEGLPGAITPFPEGQLMLAPRSSTHLDSA